MAIVLCQGGDTVAARPPNTMDLVDWCGGRPAEAEQWEGPLRYASPRSRSCARVRPVGAIKSGLTARPWSSLKSHQPRKLRRPGPRKLHTSGAGEPLHKHILRSLRDRGPRTKKLLPVGW